MAFTEEELKRIDVPVEIVIGARSPVKRMYVTPLRPVRPDWPVVEIEGARHINCIANLSVRIVCGAFLPWLGRALASIELRRAGHVILRQSPQWVGLTNV